MYSMSKVILTGVTPSGSGLHVGNYFGAIKPLVELGQSGNRVYCFVSDLHALTTVQNRSQLENNLRSLILDYLACGLQAPQFIFFRQSQVSAHSELAVILANYVSLGQMKRMHAYKDKLQKNADQGAINLGLFNYPVLMAADILLYNADLVPVGIDQKQHLEIARDIAQKFNQVNHCQTFTLPQPLIDESLGKIVGTDGQRKMSKSLGNVIGIFDDPTIIEKQIMSCYTDPHRQHATDKGRVEGNPVFFYHDLWNTDKKEVATLKAWYREGKIGDVAVKQALCKAHHQYFAAARQTREYLASHPEEVEKILARGAGLARLQAELNLAKVKKAVGLQVNFSLEPLLFSPTYQRPLVNFEHFLQLEMRVGKVIAASAPKWSKKLIKQQVDFGTLGQKTIFSALRSWFTPEDFLQKSFVYVTNIPERKMGEEVSQGMILAVVDEKGAPVRWEIAGAAPGTLVG